MGQVGHEGVFSFLGFLCITVLFGGRGETGRMMIGIWTGWWEWRRVRGQGSK
jgi:hypothetical protein